MFLLNSKIEVREFERASKNSSQPGSVLDFFVGEASLVEALCLLMSSSSSAVSSVVVDDVETPGGGPGCSEAS